MIKCGAIAAVVIAGSAAGTATLVSNPTGTQSVSASDQSAYEQTHAVRGTRPTMTTLGDFTQSVGDQPRRGERSDPQSVALAMADPSGDGIRGAARAECVAAEIDPGSVCRRPAGLCEPAGFHGWTVRLLRRAP